MARDEEEGQGGKTGTGGAFKSQPRSPREFLLAANYLSPFVPTVLPVQLPSSTPSTALQPHISFPTFLFLLPPHPSPTPLPPLNLS
eukprot:766284-Hanusia_phi.AAC.4